MKNRKPFQLKNTLVVYNIVQVVLSVVLVVEVDFKTLNYPSFHFIYFSVDIIGVGRRLAETL